MNRIVVWDPAGRFPEGKVLDGDKQLAILQNKGGVTLPVEPALLGRNACAGVFMRKWGDGVVFDKMLGARGCPMMLYAVQDIGSIYWAIRVEPLADAHETKGSFKLALNSGQIGTITGGLASENRPADLIDAQPDKVGGWTLLGSSRLNCTLEGYLGLSVYGVAVGARVVWSAVTQAR